MGEKFFISNSPNAILLLLVKQEKDEKSGVLKILKGKKIRDKKPKPADEKKTRLRVFSILQTNFYIISSISTKIPLFYYTFGG